MSPNSNILHVIELLSSIADTLSKYGDDNQGLSTYLNAKAEIVSLKEIINTSDELTFTQKQGMRKLVDLLQKEIDTKIQIFKH
jgi:hypothetical protein